MADTIITADRVEVHPGDRVFDYYDGHWGTVANDIDHEGWFHHVRDGGGRGLLNGERVCAVIPRGNPYYSTHGDSVGGCRHHYVVKTPTGYVGAMTTSGPLEADLPRGLAYTYETRGAALAVAVGFTDAVTEIL